MPKLLLTLLFGILIFGCNTATEKKNPEFKPVLTIEKPTKKAVDFDFDKFKISKGRLSDIEIGMNIKEAESKFNGLVKKDGLSGNFGFGPYDSPAYLYCSGDELMFALIPRLNTDTLMFIIAAGKQFKTTNGLSPNSTIGELIEKYNDLTVQQDLLNGWEYFHDKVNELDFVFMTDEKTKIGEYTELEVPSKPKRLEIKADWIIIR